MSMKHEGNEVNTNPLAGFRLPWGFQRVQLGGERGIRTLEGFHLTAFRERPVQPLLHLSEPIYFNTRH